MKEEKENVAKKGPCSRMIVQVIRNPNSATGARIIRKEEWDKVGGNVGENHGSTRTDVREMQKQIGASVNEECV